MHTFVHRQAKILKRHSFSDFAWDAFEGPNFIEYSVSSFLSRPLCLWTMISPSGTL